MSHEVVTYLLKNKNYRKRLQFRLVLQCAPFLKGLRAACIISLGHALCAEIKEALKDTDISYVILNKAGERCLVLFYRTAAFETYLNRPEVKEFLQEYGYDTFQVEDILIHLRERIALFFDDEEKFPHEMGVILGYPTADVAGFIEYDGQNYLLSGYWKVYGNLQHARRTFGMFDRAKVCAVNEFVAGKSIEEIACI